VYGVYARVRINGQRSRSRTVRKREILGLFLTVYKLVHCSPMYRYMPYTGVTRQINIQNQKAIHNVKL